ncbi:MAG: hypothetical protein QOC65_1449 [Sphingomonadales bacterium]|nr:hypothetical protein [Sphingomonadales bacterium]
MIFKRFALPAALAAAAAAAVAQTPASDFAPERFRAHVTFLADDLLEGRETGTRGYDIAARYVAAQYEALGLSAGGPQGSWYQQVPFVRFAMTAPARMTVGSRSFVHGEGLTVRQHPAAGRTAFEAAAVFAGWGLEAPGLGLDDYRGLDVRGKVVVVLNGTPPGLPSDVAAHLNSEKRRIAARHGALGLIMLRRPTEARRPDHATARVSEPGIAWVEQDGTAHSDAPSIRFVATADAPLAEALFQGARRAPAQIWAEASRAGARSRGFPLLQSVAFERESGNASMSSSNVIGILPGSDPALANEYVLLMAHLDGLGVREGGDGDRIRNGAMDNATGVATLIEVARQMTRPDNRPRRSIIFAAVTAEEKGLLGAQYLARHPVVDGRIVGVVNLDMPVLSYDFSDVIAFGAEHSTLGPIVERAAARMNVRLTPDPLPEEGLFTRSDHYNFVREGIPSVFLMTGFAGEGERAFRRFLAERYHRPGDDLAQPFDWRAGARFAELNWLIAREIADSPEAPLWYRGSFFGDAFAPRARRAARPAATP